jgi:Radical SAM superfamily/4Fe-4S single cluster domain
MLARRVIGGRSNVSPTCYQERLLEGFEPERRKLLEGMLSQIELELITACNLKCFNCDRSSRQAVSAELMTLEQVARFVDESLELGWRWRKIALLGGEPTLHPRFFEILDELDRYRASEPGVVVQLISNGYGRKVERVLARLPDWVTLRNTHKTTPRQYHFDAYNVAPQDLPEYADADFSRGCTIPFMCGMALTRYGFYPCGAGASVDRVFGWGRGIGSLGEVTPEGLVGEFTLLCRYCGHFHGKKAGFEVMSASWVEAYDRWHRDRPRLPLYGADRASR